MKLASAAGVYAIAVTPFDAEGGVDFASIDRMMDFYLKCGVDGLTILGVMGEAQKLDADEALAVVRRVIAKSEGRPIIVGVSAPGFAAMRALARGAMDLGAAGVMIAPPSHLRTDDQIVGYYRQAVKRDRRRDPLRHPGLPAQFSGRDDAEGHPRDRARERLLRDAQARGLAGPGKDLRPARLSRPTARCGASPSSAATAGCSSISRWSAAPTAR